RNDGVTNAELPQARLDQVAEPDTQGRELLIKAAETLGLTARGYHRTLRVARTLADLAGSESVRRLHIAEALSHRRARPHPQGQTPSKRPVRNPFYGS
ncbi:MAG: ATP-binding protein, partial [Pseudomonadota bacterium]